MSKSSLVSSLPRQLSVIEAAAVLSCSRDHVYDLINGKELAAVDIARRGSKQSKYRVSEAEIARYLKDRTKVLPAAVGVA